ncbi:MAG: enoyl-CoA hydratase/isomerase family protein [Rhodoferax sp.]|nr:enoyl-CoA hydratase/isomerase family protein [Rhodoferax sp.]
MMKSLESNRPLALTDIAQAAPDLGVDRWQHIQVTQVGAVLHITLNRPEARNAMSLQMVSELQLARQAPAGRGFLQRPAAQPRARRDAVRVVVLRGAGGHFCAGADLKDMAAARMRAMHRALARAEGAERRRRMPIAQVNAPFGHLCAAYANTPLAVVAVLEGTVMGGGFGLACVADVAIASGSATFRLPETSLGVVPAQIAPFLVERLGYSQAKRLAVTGGRLDAAAAMALGLVHDGSTADAAGGPGRGAGRHPGLRPRRHGRDQSLMATARLPIWCEPPRSSRNQAPRASRHAFLQKTQTRTGRDMSSSKTDRH